jgi:type I restriction enzyme S subunit
MEAVKVEHEMDVKRAPKMRFPEFEEEWEEKRLGDLCSTFKSGIGIISEHINDSGEFPVYGGNGLRGYTETFTHDGYYVLIGRQGALCGNINRAFGKSYISEHAIAICANKSSNTEWLAQKLIYLKLNRLSESSAQPGLAVSKLVKIKLIVPSLPEQQKIASFLSAVDKKIQLLTRKKELLEQYKKGVMQKLFSQEIRFKDENGKDYPDWEEKRLGQVFSVKAGGDIAKKNVSLVKTDKFKYSIYSNSDRNKGFYGYSDQFKVEGGCVTVTGRGTLGIAHARIDKFYPIVRLLTLHPIVIVDIKFYENFINRMRFFVESTGVPQLTSPQLSNYKVLYPFIAEQKKIAAFLTIVDDKIQTVQTQISQTQNFKKGLLQQMFV